MSQAPESITDAEFRSWLNAVQDWADKESIECEFKRCQIDGWCATLKVADSFGAFYVTASPRGKRRGGVKSPAETDETFPHNVGLDCSRELCRVRQHRIKRLTKRPLAARAA